MFAGKGKGATLIICKNAKSETSRLSPQTLNIEPQKPTNELINSLSQIDGAIFCNNDGICHGFGAILDGKSNGAEEPSRGSRYNSAIRYTKENPGSFAIVISDDGTVDFLPLPPPYVSPAEIEAKLEFLDKHSKYQSPGMVPTERALRWLDKRRHALDADICDRIDTIQKYLIEQFGTEWCGDTPPFKESK